MSEITTEQKCVLYERILKYMMGATEIRFKSLSKEGDYGFIEFVDVDRNAFKVEGFDDGLYLEYGSEAYMEDYGGAIEPREETRIITEIWFGEDPWATIKALKKQVQSLSEKAKDHD